MISWLRRNSFEVIRSNGIWSYTCNGIVSSDITPSKEKILRFLFLAQYNPWIFSGFQHLLAVNHKTHIAPQVCLTSRSWIITDDIQELLTRCYFTTVLIYSGTILKGCTYIIVLLSYFFLLIYLLFDRSHSDAVLCLTIAKQKDILVTGSSDKSFKMTSLKTMGVVSDQPNQEGDVTHVLMSSGESILITGEIFHYVFATNVLTNVIF